MPRARTLPPRRRPRIGARHDPTGGCVVCGGHDDEGTIRVCEECGAPYHCTCHNPPLIGTYEEGDWLCAECAPAPSATPS